MNRIAMLAAHTPAPTQAALYQARWTEGRNITFLLAALLVFAVVVIVRRQRGRRREHQTEMARYQPQPMGQYGPQDYQRH